MSIDLLLGLAIGITFTKLVGRVRSIRREYREIESRSWGKQWGGRL